MVSKRELRQWYKLYKVEAVTWKEIPSNVRTLLLKYYPIKVEK